MRALDGAKSHIADHKNRLRQIEDDKEIERQVKLIKQQNYQKAEKKILSSARFDLSSSRQGNNQQSQRTIATNANENSVKHVAFENPVSRQRPRTSHSIGALGTHRQTPFQIRQMSGEESMGMLNF